MYVQLDRLEDGRWTVLLPYPEGGHTFEVPARTLPEGASPGDVFGMSFAKDEAETGKARQTNRALMDELLGREKNGRDDR
ncbi:MAG: DUF3006 domain-containing protein [Rubrobacter sp.]